MSTAVTISNPKQNLVQLRNWRIAQYAALLNAEAGDAIEMPDYADRSVQITGTFGVGGSVNVEGSNDGVNWAILTDPQGNAITKTAAIIEQISENTRYVRARCTAGDGTTSLLITFLFRE